MRNSWSILEARFLIQWQRQNLLFMILDLRLKQVASKLVTHSASSKKSFSFLLDKNEDSEDG